MSGIGMSLTDYYWYSKGSGGGGDTPRGHVSEDGEILDSCGSEIAENLASRNHVYKIGNWKNTESKGE